MTEPTFSVEAIELGPMDNFVYIIHDHATNRAAIVDPAWDVSRIITRAKELGVVITDILLTHTHMDHINGVETLLDHCDAQVHLLKAEAKFSGKFTKSTLHHGGDKFLLGETEIEILHTPGHTPGSACFHIGGELITGDTLFVFGCGRCNLPGGDAHQMFDTLNNLVRQMPKQTIIHPGHNYGDKPSSSIQEQIDGNPFLHFNDKKAFEKYRMVDHDRLRKTPYHPIVKPS